MNVVVTASLRNLGNVEEYAFQSLSGKLSAERAEQMISQGILRRNSRSYESDEEGGRVRVQCRQRIMPCLSSRLLDCLNSTLACVNRMRPRRLSCIIVKGLSCFNAAADIFCKKSPSPESSKTCHKVYKIASRHVLKIGRNLSNYFVTLLEHSRSRVIQGSCRG